MDSLTLNEKDWRILRYCAEEVERQKDSPVRVLDMMRAWDYAFSLDGRDLTVDIIEEFGRRVHPVNEGGFRTVQVRMGYLLPPPPEKVREAIERLVEFQKNATPEEFYREFEVVHPFRDGNGRVGCIILNYLMGTLKDPVKPPDFDDPGYWYRDESESEFARRSDF